MRQTGSVSAMKAIESCWGEAFPGLPFVADVSWRHSGADSLKSILFLLRLEEQLGMEVPLDSLAPDTTPQTLAALLEDRRNGRSCDDAQSVHVPVFLLPGLLGDEPRLATFRKAFEGLVRFEVLKLPDIERSAKELASIATSATILLEQILIIQPTRPLRLFGYSMGGILAHEIAAQAVERGRQVSLLGLLDPFLKIRPDKQLMVEGAERSPLITGGTARGFTTAGQWSREKLSFGVPLLLGGLEQARRHLNSVSADIPIETLYWRRQRLLGRLRWRALRNWRPKPLDVPAILVSSDEAEEHFDVTRWKRLLPQLKRLHVGGRHLSLFEPSPLAQMVPVLTDALEKKP